MTTQLHWAPIEQAATVTPSPPAFASPDDVAPPRPKAPAPQSVPTPERPDTLKAVAAQIESYLKSVGRTLDFSVDEPTGRSIITVRDSTGVVIRQIPNAEALRLAQTLGSSPSALIDLIV